MSNSSYFYSQAEQNISNASFLEKLEAYADLHKKQIYVLDRPLTDQKYTYRYTEALIVLSPKSKLAVINYGKDDKAFADYIEDILEDIGSISDKYLYKDAIGRPRQWRKSLLEVDIHFNQVTDMESFFSQIEINDESERKKVDLLISLFIGSINDITRVKDFVPNNILDKVKQKIQLFDGEQTRFIYQKPTHKRITIQGLSGTGKTELLLHRLKDIYTNDPTSSIYFTCWNKILGDSLRSRIPSFFNFMKVEQQIEWDKRLWCTSAWGSTYAPNSGTYRYICYFYDIPFSAFSYNVSFNKICKDAISLIKEKFNNEGIKHAFKYMFIDESQDFDESFFELCELITQENIYVAGDIFQSIFDENTTRSIKPNFLLGKCYRTDPKTLMFAHALGMGLFEKKKLRWLDEEEWRDCGYNVLIDGQKYILSREPIKRFEDLEDLESIRIVEIEKSYSDTIIQLLQEIKTENPTVEPQDIGIILLDQDKQIYELANVLEVKIYKHLNWLTNKAYETKKSKPETILISNRNNVKGLEFPFVICVTKSIRDNQSYRNALYTMLTRSFIKSFFVIPNNKQSGLTEGMKIGLKEIIRNKQMIIVEPSDSEKQQIRTRIEHQLKRPTHYDLMMHIFKKLKVDKKYHSKILHATQQFDMVESDEKTLTEFVKDNLKYIQVN